MNVRFGGKADSRTCDTFERHQTMRFAQAGMIVASMRNNANPPSMINCSMRVESNSRDILTFPLIVRMATRVAHNVLAVLRPRM
jgi:hypothetical protein